MPILLLTQERAKAADELCKQINDKLERASFNRLNHFDAMRDRLRHINCQAFEVEILTNVHKRKVVEELSNSINNKLDEAGDSCISNVFLNFLRPVSSEMLV